jgi:hypothetical protein
MISRIGLAWAIGVWAIIAWGGRVAIVFDIGSAPAERLRIAGAVVTAAAAVVALAARRWERPVVLVYAGVAAVVWIRSLIVVFSEDRSSAFLVVHALLAAVSLLLATVAAISVWQRRLS